MKRRGANFNTAMDRRQLNMAGRMLVPIGPLSQLWQTAISAEEKDTGIDPAFAIEAIDPAFALCTCG